MSAARISAPRPRGLVLVRGGLDARGGDGDDWEDFCRRIGWQTAAPAPDADFEERLAEGLSAGSIAPDNVVELDLGRDAWDPASDDEPSFVRAIRRSFVHGIEASAEGEAPPSGPRLRRDVAFEPPRAHTVFPAAPPGGAAEADFAPDAEADRPRRAWARAGAAALTALALAAAVLLAVTRLAVFQSRTPAASIAAPSAELMHATTADARDRLPVDGARLDAPPPPEAVPERVSPPDGPTAKPAPDAPRAHPRGPRDARPVPPGALVARRSPEPAARRRALTVDRSAGWDPREGGLANGGGWGGGWSPGAHGALGGDVRPAVAGVGTLGAGARAGSGIHPDPAAPWGEDVRSRVALSAANSAAPAPGGDRAGVWSSDLPAAGSAVAERAQAMNASWSLAGAGDRWVGASLTPSLPSVASANVGVMLQVDLGKALGKL